MALRLFLSVAGCLLAATALASSPGSEEPVELALAADDHCAAGTPEEQESCALNALQLRGAKIEGAASLELQDEDDGGASQAIEAALLEAVKPAAAAKKPATPAARQDLTEEEFANLTTEINETQSNLDNLKAVVQGFWERVNATQTAIDESALLQDTASVEKASSHTASVTGSSRRRGKGAPPLHTKIQRKLAHAQDDVDFLWSSITDLRRANDAAKDYMTSHRRKLTLAEMEATFEGGALLRVLDGKPTTAAPAEEKEKEETGGAEFSGLEEDTTALGKIAVEVMDLKDELEKVNAEIANVAKIAKKWVAAR